MDKDIDERMLDINSEGKAAPWVFINDDDRAIAIAKKAKELVKAGTKRHNDNCDGSDSTCRGDTPFIIDEIKVFFLHHPELTELERLGLVADVFHYIGADTAALKERFGSLTDKFGDMLQNYGNSSSESDPMRSLGSLIDKLKRFKDDLDKNQDK